jgi:hypothetical protein
VPPGFLALLFLMFARSFCGRAGTVVRCSSNRIAMPLRAKVTNPAFAGKAQVSSSESDRKEGADELADGYSFAAR